MNKPRIHWGIGLIEAMLFTVFFIIHYLNILQIKRFHANAFLLLPFFIAFCMFAQELTAAFTGLTLGIFMDAFSSGSSLYNTFFLFILGTAIAVLVRYLLNVNFRSALMLSIVSSLVYYLLRWFLYYAFNHTLSDSTAYIMQYALPSVIYTNLFIIPFYFLQKRLNSLKKDR